MNKYKLKWKKYKKNTKKYKNIFLILLLIFTVVLDNYSDYTRNNKKETNDENKVSYFASFGKYTEKNGYIYVGDDTDTEILSNVIVNSTKGIIEEGYIRFYQWDYVFKEYLLGRISFGDLKVSNKKIEIKKNTTYEDVIKNITVVNATYKIFENNTEITSGNITNKMQLKVYYNNEVVDTYSITDDYIDISNLNIKNSKYIITNVSTVSNLKQNIDTSGTITIIDKDGNILNDNSNLTTNSKVKIQLPNSSYEYTIVVLGDVTGNGDIFIGDISKLYQYYKNTIEMEECYIIAGDVTYDGVIKEDDINKLYQYYKKIINSL